MREHRCVTALASLAKERAHGGAMEEMRQRRSVNIAAFWDKAAGVNLKLCAERGCVSISVVASVSLAEGRVRGGVIGEMLRSVKVAASVPQRQRRSVSVCSVSECTIVSNDSGASSWKGKVKERGRECRWHSTENLLAMVAKCK